MQYILALTFLLAPTYVIRFNLWGVPANVLMIWLGIVWVIFAAWLIKNRQVKDFFDSISKIDKKLMISLGLLFLAASVSLFVNGIDKAKLGQYIVLFVQPLSIFFIARFLYSKVPASREILLYSFYIFLFVIGVYAVVQYSTLIGLPRGWWGNSIEPKRALTFFAHPDFFALFITPVLAFLIPDTAARLAQLKKSALNIILPLCWLGGLVGLIYSLSRGGWIGFLAAAAMFVLISANKKYLIGAAAVVIAASAFVYYIPNFRYRVILPFYGQRSAFARLTVWDAGLRMVKDSPILGKGLNGYSNNWESYTSDSTLEHHNYPHQIFLAFWVDTGLLGLLGFIGVCLYGFIYGLKNKANNYAFGVLLFLVAILVHGLVDNPYFKNDLALVFWLIYAFLI
jgi:O-antigen ligase